MRCCVLLLVTASLVSVAPSAHADDIVFLKNGGRVRGTVLESDPSAGTRIKLLDGSIKSLKPGEVDHVDVNNNAATPPSQTAPRAPSAVTPPPVIAGALRIASEEPG